LNTSAAFNAPSENTIIGTKNKIAEPEQIQYPANYANAKSKIAELPATATGAANKKIKTSKNKFEGDYTTTGANDLQENKKLGAASIQYKNSAPTSGNSATTTTQNLSVNNKQLALNSAAASDKINRSIVKSAAQFQSNSSNSDNNAKTLTASHTTGSASRAVVRPSNLFGQSSGVSEKSAISETTKTLMKSEITENKPLNLRRDKIDLSKYELANAEKKYVTDKLNYQQSGAEGRISVNANISAKQFKINSEYRKKYEKKSEEIIKSKFDKNFGNYRDKILADAGQHKFHGDIELYFDETGKLKKYKFAKSDITKNKQTRQSVTDYVESLKLILPIDMEVMAVVIFDFNDSSASPELKCQFFWD